MPKFRIGDMANGCEMSADIIEAASELEAIRKMLAVSSVFCEEVSEDTAITLEL